MEFLEIVDKTALSTFHDSFGFDIVDKIFQLKANFQCHLMRNSKVCDRFSAFPAKVYQHF